MRIVFDTNVLIAALITAEGVCGNLVKRCAIDTFQQSTIGNENQLSASWIVGG